MHYLEEYHLASSSPVSHPLRIGGIHRTSMSSMPSNIRPKQQTGNSSGLLFRWLMLFTCVFEINHLPGHHWTCAAAPGGSPTGSTTWDEVPDAGSESKSLLLLLPLPLMRHKDTLPIRNDLQPAYVRHAPFHTVPLSNPNLDLCIPPKRVKMKHFIEVHQKFQNGC